MAILIDQRGGATAATNVRHYPTRLQSLIPDSILTRLDSGDVAFTGVNGTMIGIELKQVSDALGCIYSSRLADTQLPAMAQVYDVRYLLIEGMYRGEPSTGVLQRFKWFESEKDVKCGRWYDAHAGRNRIMFGSFEQWLTSMSELGQARLQKSPDIEGTASIIMALHSWWNKEDHRSFKVFDEWTGDTASLTRPGMLHRILADIPRIGWTRSKDLLSRFRGVKFITKDGRVAEASDFVLIKTRKDGVQFHDIGIETAEGIIRILDESDN